MARRHVDLLVKNATELLTLAGPPGPRAGHAQRELALVRNGSVAIRAGRIVDAGPAEAFEDVSARHVLDARGGVVMPGFVDAHTHPVFAGSREHEFHERLAGRSYAEIARAGGGILSTVAATREASPRALRALFLDRLDAFLEHGTTTIEAKSGYGLDTESEVKQLRVVRSARGRHPVECVPTFLGAHEVPPEHRAAPSRYVDLLCEQSIPRVARAGLAEFCDVFCEAHVFSVDASRRILERGKALGLRPKVHADEIEGTGGAELAAEVGAVSAEHLVAASDAGIAAMARAGVVAVLLPGTSFHLGKGRFARARAMIDAGVPVAIATDFNPGTSPSVSLPLVIALACVHLRLTAAEAIVAATANAAHAIGRGHLVGTLEPGRQADLLVLDVPNHHHFGYQYGRNPVSVVVKRGRVVWRRRGGRVR